MSDFLNDAVGAVLGMFRSSAGEALRPENAQIANEKGVEITTHPNPIYDEVRTPTYVRLFNNEASADISTIALAPDKVTVNYKDGSKFEQVVNNNEFGTAYVVDMAGDRMGNRNPQISIVGGKEAKPITLQFESSPGKSWPTTVGLEVSDAPANSTIQNVSAPTRIEVTGLHGDRFDALLASEAKLPNQATLGDLTLMNSVKDGMTVETSGSALDSRSTSIGPTRDGAAPIVKKRGAGI